MASVRLRITSDRHSRRGVGSIDGVVQRSATGGRGSDEFDGTLVNRLAKVDCTENAGTPLVSFRLVPDVSRLAGAGQEAGQQFAGAAAFAAVDDLDGAGTAQARQLAPVVDLAGEDAADLGDRQVNRRTGLVERNGDRGGDRRICTSAP